METKHIQPAILSVKNACAYLGGICPASFYNYRHRLDCVKIGKRSFVTVASLDRLIAASRVKPSTSVAA